MFVETAKTPSLLEIPPPSTSRLSRLVPASFNLTPTMAYWIRSLSHQISHSDGEDSCRLSLGLGGFHPVEVYVTEAASRRPWLVDYYGYM